VRRVLAGPGEQRRFVPLYRFRAKGVMMMSSMAAVTVSRLGEVQAVLDRIRSWARQREDVRAAALVGSWARGAAKMESDVDLVLLTDAPSEYQGGRGWVQTLGASKILLTRPWGAVTENRLAMPTGLQVELGVATTSWAATDPVDAGTVRVASEGLIPLHDPDNVLAELLTAIDLGQDHG
jgi:predicted nucleotidyltransferase